MKPVLLTASETEDAFQVISERTEGMNFGEIWEKFGLEMLIAAAILIFGWILVKWLSNALQNALIKRGAVGASTKMLKTIIRFVLYFNVVLVAASVLDIPTNSVLALFSAFALAFSLAIKDSLALFARGVIILLSKPFIEGDLVEIPSENVKGYVSSVGLIHTRLKTFDNREVIIPNSIVTGNTLINYSKRGLRRLDLTFSVSYSADIALAKRTIREVIEAEPLAEKEPEPVVMVITLGESSVDIICKVYVKWDEYDSLLGILNEKVKLAFDSRGIEFPFNQLDVHVK